MKNKLTGLTLLEIQEAIALLASMTRKTATYEYKREPITVASQGDRWTFELIGWNSQKYGTALPEVFCECLSIKINRWLKLS
jgi:hypothetical protein